MLEVAVNVSWHGDVTYTRDIVPAKSQATVAGAGPICADLVGCLKC
jgi:hypothetical protein